MSLNATIKIIVVIFALALVSTANAQDHFFININENNGKLSKLAIINNIDDNEVNFGPVSYDKYNHRYILYSFSGHTDDYLHLITLHAPSGTLINDIALTSLSLHDAVNYMPDDPQTNKLTGLYTITDINYKTHAYFSTLNPSNSVFDTINEIKNVLNYSNGVINNSTRQFVFTTEESQAGYTDSFPQYVYIIDINSGHVVSRSLMQVPQRSRILDIEYDSILNKYFAAITYYATNNTSVTNIDPSSGAYSTVYTWLFQVQNDINFIAYDATDHYYICTNSKYCIDNENPIYSPQRSLIYNYDSLGLYYLDVVNATFAKKTTLPISTPNSTYSLYGCQYDDSLKTFYSLYMGPEIMISTLDYSKGLMAYPNPFSTTTYIPLNNNYSVIDIVLSNSTGVIIGKQISYGSLVTIYKNGLSKGIYYATLYGDKQKIGTVKLSVD